MIKMISLKCPECGADISVEEGHKQCFCQYCGAKIILDDGNTTHTYHKVDEARIKEAEVDKLIRLKELEIKQKELANIEKNKSLKIKISASLGIFSLALFLIGVFGTKISGDGINSPFIWVAMAAVFMLILDINLLQSIFEDKK